MPGIVPLVTGIVPLVTGIMLRGGNINAENLVSFFVLFCF